MKHDIVIVGAGCIGQGLAASLLLSNPDNRVFLMPSSRSFEQLKHNGIKIQGKINQQFLPDQRFLVVDQLSQVHLQQHQMSESPNIFLATKTYDVLGSLRLLKEVLYHLKPILICMQNGLGTEQAVRAATQIFDVPVLKSQVFSAIYRSGDAIFSYSGRLIIENHPAINQSFSALFSKTDNTLFNLEIAPDIFQAIYPKLVVNCICNPLSVIFNRNLGFLRQHYEPLIRAICDELFTLAFTLGLHFSFAEELMAIVLATMENYSSHFSSMYLDIYHNKPTEIEDINGAILRLSQERAIAMPLNTIMASALKEIESLRKRYASAEEFYQKEAYFLDNVRAKLLYCVVKKKRKKKQPLHDSSG